MARTMTASRPYGPMTPGQVRELTARFKAALEAHSDEIRSRVAQEMLGRSDIGMTIFAPVRALANEMDQIIRVVPVAIPVARVFDQHAGALGFHFWTNAQAIVSELGRTKWKHATLIYFKSNARNLTDVIREYESRNLVGDPWAHLADFSVDDQRVERSNCLWRRPGGAYARFKFYTPTVFNESKDGHVEVTPWSPAFHCNGIYAGVPKRK